MLCHPERSEEIDETQPKDPIPLFTTGAGSFLPRPSDFRVRIFLGVYGSMFQGFLFEKAVTGNLFAPQVKL